ncbi:MAG: PilZ domain-containing protein [Candidatus Alcyoniella australis]|nr:PilZ domain-containing protein [Candidatus Alcyoniella australis]
MSSTIQSEKRSHHRLPKRLPVLYGVEQALVRGITVNLSLSGVEIAGMEAYKLTSRIKLAILLGGQRRIEGQTVVRWTTLGDEHRQQARMTHSMGLEFITPPPGYSEMLHEIVGEFVERRRDERIEKVLKVTLVRPEEKIQGYTRNISRGGMFIVTRDVPRIGSEHELQLLLWDTRQILRVKARVIGIITELMAAESGMDPGFGVEFARFYDDGKKLLEQYLEQLGVKQ